MLKQLVLVNVGVNLQRVCMTCRRFFIDQIVTVGCSDKCVATLQRNLYGIDIVTHDAVPDGTLGLFPGGGLSLRDVNWRTVTAVAIGNERTGLPKAWSGPRASIPTRDGKCLTVEATAAIVGWEWSQC